ncbi:hypothetical protein LIT25_18455 [Bacillus sp. F19]|nr:hypothetical protein LIT25_18455 [Bacillus sp. F19]
MKKFLLDFFILFMGIIVVGLIFDPSDFDSNEFIRSKAFDLDLNGVFLAIIMSVSYASIGAIIRRKFE